jgi:hypothetical protein
LQATPLEEHVQAAEEIAIWRGKVKGLGETQGFEFLTIENAHVWKFFQLMERNMDVHVEETQVM